MTYYRDGPGDKWHECLVLKVDKTTFSVYVPDAKMAYRISKQFVNDYFCYEQ